MYVLVLLPVLLACWFELRTINDILKRLEGRIEIEEEMRRKFK